VKTPFLISPGAGEQLLWRSAGAARLGSAAELAADPAARAAELIMVVPAQKVALRAVAFAAGERRLLRQTVPYSLEDELIDEIDTQHFALGAAADGRVPVAVVERRWLAAWLERCRGAGLDIKYALPEQLLLPWREGCWSLLPESGRWLVRTGPYSGFALEPVDAALALQLLLDGAAELPRQLLVYTNAEAGAAPLLAQLPELLRGIVEVLAVPAPALPAPGAPRLDLLQGAFARSLPWRRWWREWKKPALALGIAVAAQLAFMLIQHQRLERQNVDLRRQIEQAYRSVEPRGAMVEPERQLRRKVLALQGQHGGGALALLQQVGAALKGVAGVGVQNLTYSDRQGEIRLSISAAAFKDVEAVRAAIAAGGLDAQLIGSNADGERTRAQLRITEHR
jgi:type II secretion system protein L